jgi:hypothetical protein
MGRDSTSCEINKLNVKRNDDAKRTLIKLYKAYVLPHLEYCSPLLIGISKTLKNKLENANYYGLHTLTKLGRNVREL